MNILISAYGCSPVRGSEYGIGWNVVKQIAKDHSHKCWVLTNTTDQSQIEQELANSPLDNVTFVFVAMSEGSRNSGLSHYLYYIAWQIRAFFVAKKLQDEIGFDLVHHVTYQNSWLPTWIGWLGVPLIWNGGAKDKIPSVLLKTLSLQSAMMERIRMVSMNALGRFTQWSVASRAQLILSREASQWSDNLPVKAFPPFGLNQKDIERLGQLPQRQDEPFRVVSIGRFLGWKGFALGIRAFAQFHREHPTSEYWLIGDGPEKERLQNLAKDLGCDDAVRFWGKLSRDQVLQRMAEVDVLMHPSFHDHWPTVVLEAMASGRPVVCLDIGGPSLMVQEDWGIKVPVDNLSQVINDLDQALLQLATNGEKRISMGLKGRVIVSENWSWEIIGEQMLNLYQEVINS
ncbi:glycosyltransferase family 4 protein [Moorena producens]|uniref:glycosyltransferase family 4 protein n=1 Tax=Moorena producens TaxID=1155739 RepID=UPI003C793786